MTKSTKVIKLRGYKAECIWHKDTQSWVGRVLDTKDIITFEAKDEGDLPEEFDTSLHSYFEFLKELNEKHLLS